MTTQPAVGAATRPTASAPAAGPALTGADVDVLVPTCGRPESLAVVLAGLLGQTAAGFRIVVSDQSPDGPAADHAVLAAVLRVLQARGVELEVHRHLPARGMAEQRDFLLRQARRPYVLYLDDDVLLEPEVLERLLSAMAALRCGAVGSSLTGLSHDHDVRRHEHAAFEVVEGPVRPERLRKGHPGWERWRLHNAANPTHLGRALGYGPATPASDWTAYRVAWTAGCILFDRSALETSGGFRFWRDLPPQHAGEDVVAQLRVMEDHGAVGVLPSGAHHLELPTTVRDRRVDAYAAVLDADAGG